MSHLQYFHDGASAKISTNSHETDNSVCAIIPESKMVSPLLNFECLYHYLALCLHQLIEVEGGEEEDVSGTVLIVHSSLMQ